MDGQEMWIDGTMLVAGEASGALLHADTGLSFWGGIDPQTGLVIDGHHPLHGESVAGKILAIPSGRGSCTGSAVMLELMASGHAPAGLIFAHREDILTLGILVSHHFLGRSIPAIAVSPEQFASLATARTASLRDGRVYRDAATADAVAARPQLAPAEVTLDAHAQACLAGDEGEAARLAMTIILELSRIQGATALIPVSRAHIDGCIYTGPAGLAFAEKLVALGAKVRVPTTLNAISVDRRQWQAYGVPDSFAGPASRLADAYLAMGAAESFTCAPYLTDAIPTIGEQIAWAESNAVVFANSVVGARTQKYPDFMDILIAVTGRAPLTGPHQDQPRQPQIVLDFPRLATVDDSFWPLAGYLVGLLSPVSIPYIRGLSGLSPGLDDLKNFGAAFATTSAAAMFHIEGITPEAASLVLEEGLATRSVSRADLVQAWHELNGGGDQIDLVAFGNPHFSAAEARALYALVKSRKKSPATRLMVTMGRQTLAALDRDRTADALRRFGAEILTDICWCMIDDPVLPPEAKTIMTNSGKYAHYGPGLTGRQFRFGGLAACVEASVTGRAPADLPAYLDTADL